jgi:hypothetical protein
MSDYEDWNDQYEDDLGDHGQRLIKLLQTNAPQLVPGGEKYVEGGAVGKHILPLLGGGWLVADCYAYIGIGALDAYVHFGANRTGLLGIDPQKPKTAAWLKPGVPREDFPSVIEDFPSVIKEGLYDPDGSVYERTVYVHELIIGVGRPLQRLDQPICGTAFYKSTAYNIGKRFYHEQLKTTEALIGGKRVRNMALALWEKSSEIAHGRNQYAWMAPLSRKLGVVGEPNGPSLAETTYAKSLRDAFKQGRPWMSEPLPAIAAPPTEAPSIPASERGTPKPDIRSWPDASRSDSLPTEAPQIPASEPGTPKSDIRSEPGASKLDPPPNPPDGYDDDDDLGPRSLDEMIFD